MSKRSRMKHGRRVNPKRRRDIGEILVRERKLEKGERSWKPSGKERSIVATCVRHGGASIENE